MTMPPRGLLARRNFVVVMGFRAHAQEGLSPGMLCIVAVETLGRFPAGKQAVFWKQAVFCVLQ